MNLIQVSPLADFVLQAPEGLACAAARWRVVAFDDVQVAAGVAVDLEQSYVEQQVQEEQAVVGLWRKEADPGTVVHGLDAFPDTARVGPRRQVGSPRRRGLEYRAGDGLRRRQGWDGKAGTV